MDTIGLKIKTKYDIPSCIRILREYVGLSIGEIKEKISSGDYVFECPYTDEEGIRMITNIHKKLMLACIETEVYEHGRLTTVTFLENLLNTYSEIDADVDNMIEREIYRKTIKN